MKWATKVTAFTQHTTTAYDRRNFSILDVQPIGNLQPMQLNESEYRTIFEKITIPTNTSGPNDVWAINSVINTFTWVQRNYNLVFPHDTSSLMTYLHNVIAIPLQFTITAKQFANYTVANNPALEAAVGRFPLPEDQRTTAASGASQSRMLIPVWTGALFITAVILLLVAILAAIMWILTRPTSLPYSTGIGAIDALRSASAYTVVERHAPLTSQRSDEGLVSYIPLWEFALSPDIPGNVSWLDMTKKLRRCQVTAVDLEAQTPGVFNGSFVEVVADASETSKVNDKEQSETQKG